VSVTYQELGDVAVLTLARPEVFNSIDQAVTEGIIAGLSRAGREARAAVITGAGRAFCAGADLGDLMEEYERDGPDLRKVIDQRFNPIVHALLDARVPTVAAVNGAAAGAGMGLALACDLRVMADTAFFMSAFVNVALIPDTGSAWMLPNMVGVSRAMEIAMSGRRVPADEALALGLTARVVPTDQVLAAALELATTLAAGPTTALVETRTLIHSAAAATLGRTLADEAETQGRLGSQPNHLEGMKAFLEKRPPLFR
jgi:2-(1,2-epoxy-1,2-dihydrophenyl)acetyl-CoA isomerase